VAGAGQDLPVYTEHARVTRTGELVLVRLPAIGAAKVRAAPVTDGELIAWLTHDPDTFHLVRLDPAVATDYGEVHCLRYAFREGIGTTQG